MCHRCQSADYLQPLVADVLVDSVALLVRMGHERPPMADADLLG